MSTRYVSIEQSHALHGTVYVDGAKNAVLVIIASTLLAHGKSCLYNVPASSDVHNMILLLEHLGAKVHFDAEEKMLVIDTETIDGSTVPPEIMQKMRASILVMGPLLARLGHAEVALPGGCVIGSRPIDMHLRAFEQMGAEVSRVNNQVTATIEKPRAQRIVLDYPSVGATENIIMAAVRARGETQIVNAAVEPEVLDLIAVLRKMGASIDIVAPASIHIQGVETLSSIEHSVIPDRLEAGTLLLAASGTGGNIHIPNAPAYAMDVFLEKLRQMGHTVTANDNGVALRATPSPQSISIKTMPFPGFPTDLQAPMMAALACAQGTSTVWETVYENRMVHTRELQKLGAHIQTNGIQASIHGVDQLFGDHVIATDIRAGAALVIAGLMASGETVVTGIHHLERGHTDLVEKLQSIGARIALSDSDERVTATKAHWSSQQVLG